MTSRAAFGLPAFFAPADGSGSIDAALNLWETVRSLEHLLAEDDRRRVVLVKIRTAEW
jgi:hypothetical protein